MQQHYSSAIELLIIAQHSSSVLFGDSFFWDLLSTESDLSPVAHRFWELLSYFTVLLAQCSSIPAMKGKTNRFHLCDFKYQEQVDWMHTKQMISSPQGRNGRTEMFKMCL